MLVPSRLSKKGAAFIGRFEGLRLKPYNDPVGNATVGYGHLIHHGPVTELDLKHYLGLTQAGAEELLAADAAAAATAVKAIRPRILKQTRFDALVSLAYNCGPGILAPSTAIGRAVRTRTRKGVAAAFLLYEHAEGKVLPGLRTRREAEAKLWSKGLYQ
jgi:lysozyme